MATEAFLINPPKRLKRRRKRNPVGETLVTIGANPMRRNPWYGDSAGHRIAALMRWGKVRKGRVGRYRKRVARRSTVARTAVRRRVRRFIDRRTSAYKRQRASEYRQALGFLALTAPGKKRRYSYVSGAGWVRRRRKHNPYGGTMRKRRRVRRHRNTWFGQRRRHRKAAKKGWRRGHLVPYSHSRGSRRRRVRHNPEVSLSNPRHRRHRRKHSYRRRHNPALSLTRFTGGIMNVRSWGPLAITGGLSAVTGAVVPGMIGVANPWMKYGVQAAVAIGGGMVVEKFVDKRHGETWMIVGVSMVGYQLLKEFVLQPYFPQFAVGLGEYPSYYPTSAYEEEENVSQQVGAFPQALSAFPNAMNDYPGVGAYPYDGAAY